MGTQARSHRRLWLTAGLAAAALLAVSWPLFWGGGGGARTERRTAAFEPSAGPAPEAMNRGAYRLVAGSNHVEVNEPTLLETDAGVVELDAGIYEVSVEPGRVMVAVVKGRALLRNDRRREVAREGETRTLSAVAAAPLEPAGGAAAGAEGAEGPGAQLVGQVTDREGKPLPGARIWISSGADRDAGEVAARTGTDGRFVVAGVGGAARLVGAQAAGLAPADLRLIRPAERPVFRIDFTLRHKGGALSLAVYDGDGNPLPGATVVVGESYRDEPDRAASPEGYPLRASGRRIGETDASGRALLDGLAPEWNRLRVARSGFAPQLAWVRLVPAGVTEKEVRLRRGATVSGVVRAADGAPLEGVAILLHDRSGAPFEGLAEARTDASGAFQLEHAPAGKVWIRAVAGDGRRAAGWLDLSESRRVRWDAVLEPARVLEGRVLYLGGAPVAQALLWCRPLRAARGSPLRASTAADGSFRFEKLGAERQKISVWYPGAGEASPAPPAREVVARPEEGPLVIYLPPRAEVPEAGFLEGTLVRRDGSAAVEASLRAWPANDSAWQTRGRTGADGAFRLGPLAPGRYRMELHLDGEPTLHLDGVEVRAGETNGMGALRFPEGGRVRVRISGRDAKRYVWVTSLDQSVSYTVTAGADGAFLTEELAPGRYLVAGGAPGLLEEAEVAAGATTEVELALRGGGRLEAVILDGEGGQPPEGSFRVEDELGRRVFWGDLVGAGNEVKVWLVSGTYDVSARDGSGRKAATTVRVLPGQPVMRIELILR